MAVKKKAAKKAATKVTKKIASAPAPRPVAKKAAKGAGKPAPAPAAKAKKAAPAAAKAVPKTAPKRAAAPAATKAVARPVVAPVPRKTAAPKKVAAAKLPKKAPAKATGTPPARSAAAKKAAAAAAAGRVARRTIFIDVENTSHVAELERALAKLDIDRSREQTRVIGVGNWRLIGQRLGRDLAALGAQLVHSAPVSGVRDWSDLWIAVSAGIQLGHSSPGDILEIVSNDKAFDAVGDAAAALGVVFRRIASSTTSAAAAAAAAAADDGEAPKKATRRRRRSRGGRGTKKAVLAAAPDAAVAEVSAPAPSRAPAPASPVAEPPHGASHEQITGVLARLSGGDAERWVNLDVLEKALKQEGFSRPPGSPRLVTRLRHFADIEVSPHGRVRLKQQD